MLQKLIVTLYCFIFAVTPLVFTSLNHELFEYNKMMLVYFITSIIGGLWALRILWEKRLIYRHTWLAIPVLLFLAANILSTIYSIDPHTSFWGYYTRANGGLVSIICYSILYFGLVSNFQKKDNIYLLLAGLGGGLLVSLYAIPEHFGISPSCLILYQQLNADCWVQDVQARVFATLGQPNWLAAYLMMLIFAVIYFILQTKNRLFQLFYIALLASYYLAFTFTYSRGATLGLIAGLVIMALGLGYSFIRSNLKLDLRLPVIIIGVLLVINLLFGSALTRFQLINWDTAPTSQAEASESAAPTGVTQLENGGTESGQIRLIVWQGAFNIFKQYPIFGSGVETFAYSYYQFRPAEHNLVSEWDFLYNKAHNEFLNYLANTGIVGFSSYLLIILTMIIWSIWQFIRNQDLSTDQRLLILLMLAAYVGYLVQNFFGFSVVIIAVFFYLFPAIAINFSGNAKDIVWATNSRGSILILRLLDRRRIIGRTSLFTLTGVVIILTLNFCLGIGRMWVGDVFYASGSRHSDNGQLSPAYRNLTIATSLNGSEPLYWSERGYIAASAALALAETDATSSAEFKTEAALITNRLLQEHPANVSLFRTAIRTYYELAIIDPSFQQKTIDSFNQAITLAPTDAKLYYNKALILQQMNQPEAAVQAFQSAITLKPNYREAYYTLGLVYDQLDQRDQAISQMQTVLKLVPNDPGAVAKLEEWGITNP